MSCFVLMFAGQGIEHNFHYLIGRDNRHSICVQFGISKIKVPYGNQGTTATITAINGCNVQM